METRSNWVSETVFLLHINSGHSGSNHLANGMTNNTQLIGAKRFTDFWKEVSKIAGLELNYDCNSELKVAFQNYLDQALESVSSLDRDSFDKTLPSPTDIQL